MPHMLLRHPPGVCLRHDGPVLVSSARSPFVRCRHSHRLATQHGCKNTQPVAAALHQPSTPTADGAHSTAQHVVAAADGQASTQATSQDSTAAPTAGSPPQPAQARRRRRRPLAGANQHHKPAVTATVAAANKQPAVIASTAVAEVRSGTQQAAAGGGASAEGRQRRRQRRSNRRHAAAGMGRRVLELRSPALRLAFTRATQQYTRIHSKVVHAPLAALFSRKLRRRRLRLLLCGDVHQHRQTNSSAARARPARWFLRSKLLLRPRRGAGTLFRGGVLALHRSTLRTAVAHAGQQHRRKCATAARIHSAASHAPAAATEAAQAAAAGQGGKAGVLKQFCGLTPEQRQAVQRRTVAAVVAARGRHGRNLRKHRAEALSSFRAKPRHGQHKLSVKQVRVLKSQLAKALLMQQLRLLQKPTSTEAQRSLRQQRLWQGPRHRSPAQIIRDNAGEASGSATAARDDEDTRQSVGASTNPDSADVGSTDSTDTDNTGTDSTGTGSTDAVCTDALAAPVEQQQEAQHQRWQLNLDTSFNAFLARAASPGVLLQVLRHHADMLSAAQCSLTYLRIAQLCRASPALLQRPSTHRLLQLLRGELPRVKDGCKPWHLALMTTSALHLQQPQLVRVMLPRLLQQETVQLLLCAAVCLRAQQMQLVRVMLRLMLLQDVSQVIAYSPSSAAAGLARVLQRTGSELDRDEQQQLLSTLLELQDGSMPQLMVAIWAAASMAPKQQEIWQHLLHAFLRLLPSAPTAAVAVVLRAAAWARLPLSGEQLQQLLAAFEQQLPAASMVDIRIALGAAVLISLRQQHPISHDQIDVLLSAWEAQLPAAQAEDIAGMLSGLAAAGHKIRNVPLQQLMSRFVEVLPEAAHWQITAVLQALGTLRLSVHQTHLQQLLEAFMQQVPPAAAAQSMCKVVYAVALMQQGWVLTQEQLQRFDEVWAQAWPGALAKDWPRFYSALWACSQIGFLPTKFLDAARDTTWEQLFERAEAASVPQITSVVTSSARLGSSKRMSRAYAKVAMQRLQNEGAAGFGAQAAAGLCWAVTIRSKGTSPYIPVFAAACREQWDALGVPEKQMLNQVHLMRQVLVPKEQPPGLRGMLSRRQLDECRAAWWRRQDSVPARTSRLQQQVFDLVVQLSAETWAKPPVPEHRSSIFSIDIAAVRADGKRLAIEVDGPVHFILPDNRLDGTTECRNRVLKAQGWTVVSIPYFEFQALPKDQPEQQLEYLRQKVQEA